MIRRAYWDRVEAARCSKHESPSSKQDQTVWIRFFVYQAAGHRARAPDFSEKFYYDLILELTPLGLAGAWVYLSRLREFWQIKLRPAAPSGAEKIVCVDNPARNEEAVVGQAIACFPLACDGWTSQFDRTPCLRRKRAEVISSSPSSRMVRQTLAISGV